MITDAILNRAPTAAVRLNPDIPPKLEDVVNKALEKDKKLRYQSAADMRTDLQRLKRDTDTGRLSATTAGAGAVGEQRGKRWIVTVSYTHLDVYKRQVLGQRAGVRSGRRSWRLRRVRVAAGVSRLNSWSICARGRRCRVLRLRRRIMSRQDIGISRSARRRLGISIRPWLGLIRCCARCV